MNNFNPIGSWCWRNGRLCDHNHTVNHMSAVPFCRSDQPCTSGSGFTARGNPYVTKQEIDQIQLNYGGAPHEWLSTEEGHLNEVAQQLIVGLAGDFIGAGLPGETRTLAGNSTSATYDWQPEDALTFDKIQDTIAKLFKQPVIRGVWFVDCPQHVSAVRRMLNRVEAERPVKIDGDAVQSGLFSIPFFEWSIATATADEVKNALKHGWYFIHSPGVWLEMSDGLHRKVSIP